MVIDDMIFYDIPVDLFIVILEFFQNVQNGPFVVNMNKLLCLRPIFVSKNIEKPNRISKILEGLLLQDLFKAEKSYLEGFFHRTNQNQNSQRKLPSHLRPSVEPKPSKNTKTKTNTRPSGVGLLGFAFQKPRKIEKNC